MEVRWARWHPGRAGARVTVCVCVCTRVFVGSSTPRLRVQGRDGRDRLHACTLTESVVGIAHACVRGVEF